MEVTGKKRSRNSRDLDLMRDKKEKGKKIICSDTRKSKSHSVSSTYSSTTFSLSCQFRTSVWGYGDQLTYKNLPTRPVSY